MKWTTTTGEKLPFLFTFLQISLLTDLSSSHEFSFESYDFVQPVREPEFRCCEGNASWNPDNEARFCLYEQSWFHVSCLEKIHETVVAEENVWKGYLKTAKIPRQILSLSAEEYLHCIALPIQKGGDWGWNSYETVILQVHNSIISTGTISDYQIPLLKDCYNKWKKLWCLEGTRDVHIFKCRCGSDELESAIHYI